MTRESAKAALRNECDDNAALVCSATRRRNDDYDGGINCDLIHQLCSMILPEHNS